MKNENLDSFGEFLIKNVRDETIDDFLRLADGRMLGADGARLRQEITQGITKEFFTEELVPYIVDHALANFLASVEESDAKLLFSKDGATSPDELKNVSDGLAGELFGDGWIKQYSQFPHSMLGR